MFSAKGTKKHAQLNIRCYTFLVLTTHIQNSSKKASKALKMAKQLSKKLLVQILRYGIFQESGKLYAEESKKKQIKRRPYI